jgi:uncharacterized membrane protein
LAVLLCPAAIADWGAQSSLSFDAMAVLGGGAALAALAAFVAPVGRLFLERTRAEAEARQYAQGMFLDRALFRTRERRAVLILASRYEGVGIVLPDAGVARHAPSSEIERIARAMSAPLRSGAVSQAFAAAFDGLRAVLSAHGYAPETHAVNELEDAVVTERGA